MQLSPGKSMSWHLMIVGVQVAIWHNPPDNQQYYVVDHRIADDLAQLVGQLAVLCCRSSHQGC